MNPIMLRVGVIGVALVIRFWTRQVIARKSTDLLGIGDGIHRLTAK
jgi:hypothetical protein